VGKLSSCKAMMRNSLRSLTVLHGRKRARSDTLGRDLQSEESMYVSHHSQWNATEFNHFRRLGLLEKNM